MSLDGGYEAKLLRLLVGDFHVSVCQQPHPKLPLRQTP
jgi:hypothetical protein